MEIVCHQVAGVAVVGAVAGVDGAEPAVVHAGLHGEVDYGFVFTIVYTRQAREVALAIDHLEFVHHIGGNIFRRHGGVVGEEIFSVDKDFLDFLAVGGDFSVGAHLDAREALEEIFDHRVGLSLISVGVVFDGVFFDSDRCFNAYDYSLFEQDGVGCEGNHTEVHVAVVRADSDAPGGFGVAHIAEFEHVFARFDALDVEHTVKVGGCAFNEGAVFVGTEQLYRGFHQLGGVGGISIGLNLRIPD